MLTANTVISSENASMETMGTDQVQDLKLLNVYYLFPSSPSHISCQFVPQLLDLFSLEGNGKTPNGSSNTIPNVGGVSSGSVQGMLSTLPDLWDAKEYEEEYDIKTFMSTLRKN